MELHTLLIATADQTRRAFLAAQLDADGHSVYEAESLPATVSRLSAHAIDVLILGDLGRPGDAPGLLRSLRAHKHPHVHPGMAVMTLGATDQLTVLRAYDSGSDHHLPADISYLVLRAVLQSVARRALDGVTARHLHVGEIDVDLAARSVTVADSAVSLSRLEFELLVRFASDPARVFSKHELRACIWPTQSVSDHTIDSHVNRPRARLTDAGARAVLVNKFGQGWSLRTPTNSHRGDTCLPDTEGA